MCSGFTRSDRAIVTTETRPDHFVMVNRCRRHGRPTRRGFLMTGITHIARRDVIVTLATGRDAVVTADAIARERRVVHGNGGCPGSRAMATVTFQCGHNMPGGFTGCQRAVMTARAHTDDFIVIHCAVRHRGPRCRAGLMTGIAYIARGNMVRALAAGDRAIVTTEARTNNLIMIHRRHRNRRPGGWTRQMTAVA